MDNWFDKNKFFEKLLVLTWVLFFFFCLFLLSFTSHASQNQDYFPMYQNYNGHFSEELKQNIATRFNSTDNYVFVYYHYFNPNSGYGRYYYYYLAFPKSSTGMWYGEKYSNLQQFSLYQGGQTNFLQGSFYCDRRTPNTIEGLTSSDNPGQWMQGLDSSNYNSSIDYVSNFQIFTNNTSAKQIVLLYDDGVSIPDGDTARDDMEKPDINDYIPDWSTPPSFDNSSVENALESVYDIVIWLGNNVKDTIVGSGKYIVDSVMWGLQRIIDTIRDKIDDLKNSINGFLSSINGFLSDTKGFFVYLIEPLDVTELENNVSSSNIYQLISVASSGYSTYKNFFDNISVPTTLSFHIPYTILTHSGYIDFNFGWYSNIKDSVLPWIIGFLYAGFGLAVFRSIPSIINGVSGILTKGG